VLSSALRLVITTAIEDWTREVVNREGRPALTCATSYRIDLCISADAGSRTWSAPAFGQSVTEGPPAPHGPDIRPGRCARQGASPATPPSRRRVDADGRRS
jgi:hypothetical protein